MIPKTIHFIWISLGETMTELQKLSILSAVLHTACKVVLHTDDASVSLPGVSVRLRTFPTEINGKPFCEKPELLRQRISHLKDVVRLQILYEEGGIYSDFDVIWLKDPYQFLNHKVVISYTNKSYKIMCNAIMMAEPKQEAIKQYLDWTISIFPPKVYWAPANPYKLWKDRTDIKDIDKYFFFPRNYSDLRPYTFKQVEKSICCHLYSSLKHPVEGELIDALRLEVEQLYSSLPSASSSSSSTASQ